MRDVAWDTGNIPFLEMQGIAAEFQGTAVAVAHADFQTVVEVETAAGNVRYFPVISGKQEGREVQGEEVVAVFNNDFFWLWHRGFSFLCFCAV